MQSTLTTESISFLERCYQIIIAISNIKSFVLDELLLLLY